MTNKLLPSKLVTPAVLLEYLSILKHESDADELEASFNDRYHAVIQPVDMDALFIEHVEDRLYSWHYCDVCSAHYPYAEPCEFH